MGEGANGRASTGVSMAQKFLSIKNFEKYQTKSAAGRPWIKLYKSVLGDPEFMKLSTHHRFLYTGLLLLADDCNNRIYNDRTYIGQRLYISPTEVDLKPLYRAGFLDTSNLSRTLSEKSREEESRSEESRGDVETSAPQSTLSKLDEFHITPDIEAWGAKEEISDVSSYLEEFKDYWRSVGGKRRNGQVIKDWSAAFKNRLRDLKKSNKLKTANVWGD